MGLKVTFNPIDHLIEVTTAPVSGIVTLDFQVDVYSDGKEDWLTDLNLAKHQFPVRVVGGDPLPGGLALDATFFLAPPWKIYPYDADHELVINGNVFSEDGSGIATGRAGHTISVRLISTFSAGASGGSGSGTTADEIWAHTQALNIGRFIALK